jgi:H+/Cl- antiporter ClcA
LLGPYLYLGYPKVNGLSSYIFLWVIVVAVFAGLAGSIMAKIILAMIRWKSTFKFKRQHVIYIIVCGLALASLAVFIDTSVLGSGKALMTHTLFTGDKYVSAQTPVLRIAGPILSFTTGAAGGVFAPSLGCGAGIGSFLSGLLHLNEANSNIIILAGMVGFLTGVTRSPFTSAILVLEMTDRHNVIFHLMIAGMIASLVSMLIDRHSFYDRLKVQYLQDVYKESPVDAPVNPLPS